MYKNRYTDTLTLEKGLHLSDKAGRVFMQIKRWRSEQT